MNPSLKAVVSIGIVCLNYIAYSTRYNDIVALVRMAEDASARSDVTMKIPRPVRPIVTTEANNKPLAVKSVSGVAELIRRWAVWW